MTGGAPFRERPRGYCALGGALLTATAMKGVVPILHAAQGCAGSIYWNQIGGSGHMGAGYCGGLATPSTNVLERDIVFGGHERLLEQVTNTLRVVDGQLYVILTGCTTDIIGDDVRSVARELSTEAAPVISAETGGFRGDGYKGYDILLQALFSQYVLQNRDTTPGLVNLWGIVPGQDPFWRGNLEELRRLLEGLGLTVNALFTERDNLESLRNCSSAQLNIVASGTYGVPAAKAFEARHGVGYVAAPLPIGPTATRDFIGRVAEALGVGPAVPKGLVEREERRYYSFVERVADSYNDLDLQRYAVVVGDANYAPAVSAFLGQDLGWLPELTVVTDALDPGETAELERYLAEPAGRFATAVRYESDASRIQPLLADVWPRYAGQKHYDSFSPAFVVGSHLEREFARNIGAAHLSVSYPAGNRVVLNRGYAGYEGALHLIEDLLSVLVAER